MFFEEAQVTSGPGWTYEVSASESDTEEHGGSLQSWIKTAKQLAWFFSHNLVLV